jgi:hypothetical protein
MGTIATVSNLRVKSVSTEIGVPMFLAIVACLSGCGDGRPRTYPAGGRVVFADGAPLQGGNIELAPKEGTIKTSARAMIESDGTFRLSTFGDGDGALPGDYRVSIIPARHRGEEPGKAARTMDGKYQSFDTSGLEANVSPDGANNFEFVVSPATGK